MHAGLRPHTRWVRALLAICLLAAALAGTPLAAQAAATTWYVDQVRGNEGPGCGATEADPCRTVSGAVAKADDGDTISVAAGRYVEVPLRLQKSITLRGAGVAVVDIAVLLDAATPTVTVGDGGRAVVATLEDLTVRSGLFGHPAILVNAGSVLDLRGAAVRRFDSPAARPSDGVVLATGARATIVGSTIGSNNNGVVVSGGAAATITGTTLTENTSSAVTVGAEATNPGELPIAGHLTMVGSSVSNSGVGVRVGAGRAMIADSTVAQNAVGVAAGVATVTVAGGSVTGNTYAGIVGMTDQSTITIDGVEVRANAVGGEGGTVSGGVVMMASGSITVVDSTVAENYNGIFVAGGVLEVTGSRIIDSRGVDQYGGAGIAAAGGVNQGPNGPQHPRFTVTTSEISGNQIGLLANQASGSVELSTVAGNRVAGILAAGESVTRSLTANRTQRAARWQDLLAPSSSTPPVRRTAVDVPAGTLLVTGSTIADNGGSSQFGFHGGLLVMSGTTILGGSIVQAKAGSVACAVVSGATLDDGGHNLDTDDSCGWSQVTSTSSTSPQLSALGSNGGLTRTMLPAPGAPVVDRIPAGAMLVGLDDVPLCAPGATDQRGMARPQGPGCDLGAVELRPPLVITTEVLPNGVVGADYATTLAAAGGDGAPYGWTLTDARPLPPGLSLSSAGTVSGTPTVAGTYVFSVTVDGSVSKQFSITVTAPTPTAPATTTPTPPVTTPPVTTPPVTTPPTPSVSATRSSSATPTAPAAEPNRPDGNLADTGSSGPGPMPGIIAGVVAVVLGTGLMLVGDRRRQLSRPRR